MDSHAHKFHAKLFFQVLSDKSLDTRTVGPQTLFCTLALAADSAMLQKH